MTLPLVPAARADSIILLTVDGCTGGCGVIPFGQVDLHQTDAATVLVTETLFNGDKFVKTGGHDALTFNISGDPAITITGLTTGFTVDAAPSNPPFGAFNYGILCSGCGSGTSNPLPGPLSFSVTRNILGNLSISEFIANAGGHFFASDIVGTTGNTGAVAADVPEPSQIIPLAIALGLLLLLKRHKAPGG